MNTQKQNESPILLGPAIRHYIDRIGARAKSFRHYVVEVPDGSAYMGGHRKIADIYVADDGVVSCDKPEYLPTADEQEAIKAEVARRPFPHSIHARKGSLPDRLKGVDPRDYFVFCDDVDPDKIIFIQWRVYSPDKADLPFSFWNDGQWRMAEPEGKLPIWGLDQIGKFNTYIIHEGAKGARDVRAMVEEDGDELAARPWRDHLIGAAHLGWPGGAPNADRVDWSPFKRLPANARIIIVADNDAIGKDAVAHISRTLGRSFSALMFDDRFAEGFDMADPWPERQEWSKGEKYVGPSFDDCLKSATWATKINPPTGKRGRPSISIRADFAKEWWWTPKGIFVHRDHPDRLLNEEGFNRHVRPFSDTADTAKYLKTVGSSETDEIIYDPGRIPA